jgi:ComF family protein
MLLRQIIALITPVSCAGCGCEGALLCLACRQAITLPTQVCFVCGLTSVDGVTCEVCAIDHTAGQVVVAAQYETVVKDLILALKFDRNQDAADVLAQLVIRALPADLAERLDGITAVPVSPARRRERGYNQTELVARAVARRLGLPYRVTLRRRGRVHQLGATRAERFLQVADAFASTRPVAGAWLVIDDVITTGATAEACAKVLTTAGAERVAVAVVAGQRA